MLLRIGAAASSRYHGGMLKRLALVISLAVVSGPFPAGAAALRGLAAGSKSCWAVGDAGCVLRSNDDGRTWRRVAVPVEAHFQSVALAAGQVLLFGGQAVSGHPAAQGRGVLLRTTDGGRSFRALPATPAGWLYGGCLAGKTAVAYGQSYPLGAGGVACTIDGGRRWYAAAVTGRGFLLAGDFHSPRHGWLVGQGRRIVPLRDLREPGSAPPPAPAGGTLRAVRYADDETCWAVGDNATVLRSRPLPQAWDPLAVGLPPGARRCADLEALALAGPQRAWVGGGLLAVVAHTDNGGGRWTLLPAPTPGGLHALARTPDGALLAAGDAERIWRSDDDGKTWTLVHGPRRTDVLFVLAAGDRSAVPAIVAHALAGDSVAVLFATHYSGGPGTPGDQPLRAAAARAGADGIATLTEFASVAGAPAAATWSEADILRRWSVGLDTPARGEMLRQIVAAIRLFRPTVLAVGPDAPGARGRRGENHLVSRLAQQAASSAADANTMADLARVGLAPWRVRRVFVGLAANERWTAPWQGPPRVGREQVAVALPGERFPADGKLPLGLLAARAVWHLPGTGLLDRPGTAGAYRCASVPRAVRLFTTGLGPGRLVLSRGEPSRRIVATCAYLRAAIAQGQIYSAATDLIAQLSRDPAADGAALLADRLLLCWWRLFDEGKLVEADTVMTKFITLGKSHPRYESISLLVLATAASGEYQAQLATRGRAKPMKLATLERAATGLSRWPVWSLWAPGRMLHAKALAAAGQLPQARSVLAGLSREPYAWPWRRCALLELNEPATLETALQGRRRLAAAFVTEAGRLDGALTEAAWNRARRVRLLRAGEVTPDGERPASRAARRAPSPSLQAVRSAGGFVIFALRLPNAEGRSWRVDLAVDADRDAWTQIVLRWDTRGTQGARLALRGGPAADLGRRGFQIAGRQSQDEWTFELGVSARLFAPRPAPAELWHVQCIATARDAAGERGYFFQPQTDRRLLPERYGLLKVPAREGLPPARRGGPGVRALGR